MTSPLRLVTDKEAISEALVEKLRAALVRAEKGEIEGFSLVILGAKVESSGHFMDRLQMLGALQMAIARTMEASERL